MAVAMRDKGPYEGEQTRIASERAARQLGQTIAQTRSQFVVAGANLFVDEMKIVEKSHRSRLKAGAGLSRDRDYSTRVSQRRRVCREPGLERARRCGLAAIAIPRRKA